MSRLAKLVILSLSVLVFSYLSLGYVLGKTTTDDKAYRSLGVYGEVLQRIEQDYVDDPDMALVTAGALHGLLESLDPLSSYMSPLEYAEYKKRVSSGARAETGMALSKRYGYIIVISVLPDSPAQKAGLRTGDILEAVAGFTTREMSVAQAMQLLGGQPGTSVKVSVVRRGNSAPQDADIVRAQLGPSHLIVDRADPEIGYLRVSAFDAGKADEIREKLMQFDKQGIHKLVLDLRDCARGEYSEAVAVARLFLNSGTIASLKGQTVTRQEFSADPSKLAWKYPVTVLISNSTSGAAEIVAAGIGGNKRGDVVGERTFGSASEQKLIPFEDGAAIVLTVANYFTPAGKSIADEGVPPTVEIRGALEDQADAGNSDTPAPLNNQPTAKYPSPDDPVLHRAIELLKNETPRKVAQLRLPTSVFYAFLNALPV